MLDKKTFETIKKENKRILITDEIPIGSLTPDLVYKNLALPNQLSFIFETIEDEERNPHTLSYVGVNALATFSSKNNLTRILYQGQEDTFKTNPYDQLRYFKNKFAPASNNSFPQFLDAIFGFVAYDAVRLVENLPEHHEDRDQVPDLFFVLFETLFIFNHANNSLTIALSVDPDSEYEMALSKLDNIRIAISNINIEQHTLQKNTIQSGPADIQVNLEDNHYFEIVKRAQEYIENGDIFQIVLSRTFTLPVKAAPLEIYKSLKEINPSPYTYLFETPEFTLVGTSPEKLVSVMNGYVETVPVGGTHPYEPKKTEEQNSQELLSDLKEVAEHNMKMEVGRNDIGAVCVPGTVEIKELRGTRIFSHVVHIITRIGGMLREDKDYLDAVISILPAATLSGCPKVRAMEIIDELELTRRGIYGGAICMIDSRGNLNSCIAIRFIFIKEGMAYVRAGAGIVAYSNPQYEANETRHKSAAAIEALRGGKHVPDS